MEESAHFLYLLNGNRLFAQVLSINKTDKIVHVDLYISPPITPPNCARVGTSVSMLMKQQGYAIPENEFQLGEYPIKIFECITDKPYLSPSFEGIEEGKYPNCLYELKANISRFHPPTKAPEYVFQQHETG